MKLARALPVLASASALVFFLACSSDSTNAPDPSVPGVGVAIDSGGSSSSSSSSSSGSPDAMAEAGNEAGPGLPEECTPDSTQCCIKYADGSIGCGGPSQPIYEACVAGNCQTPPNEKAPTAVVIRKCDANGRWAEVETCGKNCTEGSDRTVVACGYCPPSGQAVCTSTCAC